MSSNRGNYPQFQVDSGWVAQQIISTTLTHASLTGTAVLRPPGLFDATIVATFTITAGSPTATLFLEGSNDDTNWHLIASTTANQFTTTGQQITLNSATNNAVDIGRWGFLRVRAADAVATTWSMAVVVTGVAHAGNPLLQTVTNTAITTSSDAQTRSSGVEMVTAQIVCTAVVLGGASSILAAFQGSPDSGTTWVTLASTNVTTTGSTLLTQDNTDLIDLAGFTSWRLKTTDVGGVSTSYSITAYIASDIGDWILGAGAGSSGGSAVPATLANAFAQVQMTAGAVTANTFREVFIQLLDFNGELYAAGVRAIKVQVSALTLTGDVDLSGAATITAAGTPLGTVLAGSGTNTVAMTTTSAGQARVRILGVTGSYFVSVVSSGLPTTSTKPFSIVFSPEFTAVVT